MPLPDPTFARARGVLELPNLVARTPAQDDVLIENLRDAFPSVAARQVLPAGLPSGLPYLALQSTASRLAISAVGSELETTFYGEYEVDVDRSLNYFTEKLLASVRSWAAIDRQPSFLGVLLTMHFQFGEDQQEAPSRYISEHHLRQPFDEAVLQDAEVRLALRFEDTHFVVMRVANYELRTYERPVFSGQQLLQVRPWEGIVENQGIELTLDINNKLGLINREGDYAIDENEVERVMGLVRRAITAAPAFVEDGAFDLAQLAPAEGV